MTRDHTSLTRSEFLAVGGTALALTTLGGVTLGACKANIATLTYEADNSYKLRNPERGWFYDLVGERSTNSEIWYTEDQLRDFRDIQNVTLFRQYYQPDEFLDTSIPQWYLDEVAGMFEKVRNVGMKLIPRFRYVWNEELNTEDAPRWRIQEHLSQLKPIIDTNMDVLDHLQAGFVGSWGEWHHSSSGHVVVDQIQPSGIGVAHDIMDWLPKERVLLMRVPRHAIAVWGSDVFAASEAYSGTDRSRLGFHDDGFSYDWSHWGTFDSQYHKDYARSFASYTVMSGEPGWDTEYARENFLNECRWFYCQSMNMNWGDPGVQSFYDYLKETSQWDTMHRELGYRIRLTTATMPGRVTAGDPLRLTLNFQNDGMARLHNPRQLVVVLRNKTTGQTFQLGYTEKDVRAVLPPPGGGTSTLSWSPTVPGSVPRGIYDIALWMPAPEPTLRNRREYAIRLANTGLWEPETGYNIVYSSLKVQT